MTSDDAYPTVVAYLAWVEDRFGSGAALVDPADRKREALRWAEIAGVLADTAETADDHLLAARARYRLCREVNDLEAAQAAWLDIRECEERVAHLRSPAFAEEIRRAEDRVINDGQPRRVPNWKYTAPGVGDNRGEGVSVSGSGWSGQPSGGVAEEAAEPW